MKIFLQKWSYYLLVCKRLAIVLVIFQLIRLLFFVFNSQYLTTISFLEYLKLVFYSLRFDLSITLASNTPFIILTLLLLPYFNSLLIKRILQWIFISINSILFIFDLADLAYFPYVRKRMNSDVFDLLANRSDFLNLLPSYFQKFWYVIIIILLLIIAFYWLINKIASFSKCEKMFFSYKHLVMDFLILSSLVIGIRGGLQLRPLQIIDALTLVDNAKIPLVINTPFNIAHTLEQKRMEKVNYMTQSEVNQFYNPIKNYAKNNNVKKPNIVLILLESFGKAYTGSGGRTSYTPFLDSLASQGLNFTNAFANAFRSADGIPACVSGIPHFMDDVITNSPYASNEMESLPILLKNLGYHSSFFHGGTNGTMNFDSYASHAGFQNYIGRTQYNNDDDYDGTWGIWDEPFLQFVAKKQNSFKQPFFNTIFTLSSHEPFHLPSNFADESIKKLKGIQRGIAYTDLALKKYFEKIANMPWYQNTLFVITADHNFLACVDTSNFYNQKIGLFAVPMILFKPNEKELKGTNKRLTQQIDILPTILDYINYPNNFFAYGKSMFDTITPSFGYFLLDNTYYFRHRNIALVGYGNNLQSGYNFDTDSTLLNPLPLTDSNVHIAKLYYYALRQLLFNTISANKMTTSKYKTLNATMAK